MRVASALQLPEKAKTGLRKLYWPKLQEVHDDVPKLSLEDMVLY